MASNKREKKVSVKSFIRDGKRVNPFVRKQKVRVDVDTSDKTESKKLGLKQSTLLGLLGAAPTLIALAPFAKQTLLRSVKKLRQDRFKKAFQKSLPPKNIGKGVFGSIGDLGDGKVLKTTNLDRLKGRTIKQFRDINQREYKALLDLQDTGVVPKVFGQNDAGIIMEKIEGQSLFDFFNSNKSFISDDEVESVGKKVAESLKAIHDRGYRHYDLHSNNVMLTNNQEIKLIDFGLSRQTNKVGLMSRLEDIERISNSTMNPNDLSKRHLLKKFRDSVERNYFKSARIGLNNE